MGECVWVTVKPFSVNMEKKIIEFIDNWEKRKNLYVTIFCRIFCFLIPLFSGVLKRINK